MKSDVLKQPPVVYIPETEAEPRLSRFAYATLVAKHVVFTIAFVFFCIGIVIAMWYATMMFANTSYKMVALFLVLVSAANVTSRYVIWCITH